MTQTSKGALKRAIDDGFPLDTLSEIQNTHIPPDAIEAAVDEFLSEGSNLLTDVPGGVTRCILFDTGVDPAGLLIRRTIKKKRGESGGGVRHAAQKRPAQNAPSLGMNLTYSPPSSGN